MTGRQGLPYGSKKLLLLCRSTKPASVQTICLCSLPSFLKELSNVSKLFSDSFISISFGISHYKWFYRDILYTCVMDFEHVFPVILSFFFFFPTSLRFPFLPLNRADSTFVCMYIHTLLSIQIENLVPTNERNHGNCLSETYLTQFI